jgi:hypothetical protein
LRVGPVETREEEVDGEGSYIVGQVDDLGGAGGCHGVKIGKKNNTIQSPYILNKVGILIELMTGGWKGSLFPMIYELRT